MDDNANAVSFCSKRYEETEGKGKEAGATLRQSEEDYAAKVKLGGVGEAIDCECQAQGRETIKAVRGT